MKFKESIPGWLIFDDGSSKTEFKIGTKYVQDLADYFAAENEIEPQFTAEEIAAKETEEREQALLNQEKELLGLISANEYHLVSVRKKIAADREIWEDLLGTWDDQLDMVRDQIELMNEGKSFTLIQIEPVPVF